MANIAALSTLTTQATSLSNLILVSPQKTIGYQPQNPPKSDGTPSTNPPPPALLFHYEGENTVTTESDITDHFVEDNTTIQDQIALRPPMVTTHGFIGELNDVAPRLLEPLKIAADKLTALGPYAPSLSITALRVYNNAVQLYAVAQNARNSAVAAWSSVTGTGGQNVIGSNGISIRPNQNKQQLAYQQFYGYQQSRTLFTVQTPWAVFTDMAIKTLRAIQDPETNVITDFEITFKAMRFASTLVIAPPAVQGRLESQSSTLTDNGPQTPTPASVTLSDSISRIA